MWRSVRSAPSEYSVYLFFHNTMGGEDVISNQKWYADEAIRNGAMHPSNELQLTHWWDGQDKPTLPPS